MHTAEAKSGGLAFQVKNLVPALLTIGALLGMAYAIYMHVSGPHIDSDGWYIHGVDPSLDLRTNLYLGESHIECKKLATELSKETKPGVTIECVKGSTLLAAGK